MRVNDTAEILWVAGGSELWICVLELRSDRGRKVRLRDKAVAKFVRLNGSG